MHSDYFYSLVLEENSVNDAHSRFAYFFYQPTVDFSRFWQISHGKVHVFVTVIRATSEDKKSRAGKFSALLQPQDNLECSVCNRPTLSILLSCWHILLTVLWNPSWFNFCCGCPHIYSRLCFGVWNIFPFITCKGFWWQRCNIRYWRMAWFWFIPLELSFGHDSHPFRVQVLTPVVIFPPRIYIGCILSFWQRVNSALAIFGTSSRFESVNFGHW